MKKSKLLAFSIVAGIVHLWAMPSLSQNTTSQAPEKTIVLQDLLREMGNKYDCHFTMEIGLVSGDHIHSIANVYSIDRRDVTLAMQEMNLTGALELLHNTVPHLTYKFNRFNPKIIHIIDSRLIHNKNYALEKIVGDISFDGKVSDLIDAIGQKGVAVSSRGAVDIYESMGIDYSTRLTVVERKKSVRDILSNSLTLKDRGRVLWIAETELGEGQITYVRFLREFM